jgi:hypothetical protein
MTFIVTSLDAATLIHLHKLGFKLLSLSIDNEVVVPWTPIYENPDYWSAEKLIAECSNFKNSLSSSLLQKDGAEFHL